MATMKTLNGYGFNATELNGKTSDSYLLRTDTVANSADSQKLGGKAPEYYIQPRNLLDNSDFRNPVNQRGQTIYSGTEYTIDRWKIWSENGVTVNDGYITIADRAYQYFTTNTFSDATHTLALKKRDGTIITSQFAMNEKPQQDSYGNLVGSQEEITLVGITAGEYIWAALYEGSYTADTLPPYVPKGYAAELAECQRYCKKLSIYGEYRSSIIYSNGIETMIPLSVPMRVTPNIGGTLLIWNTSGAAQDGFTFSVSSLGDDYVRIAADKVGHGLTDAVLRIQSDVILSADL